MTEKQCGRLHYPGNDPEDGPAEPCLLDAGHAGMHAGVSSIPSEPPLKPRCVLCYCITVAEAFGFPVCRYHVEHGEDDPPCPDCAGKCWGCNADAVYTKHGLRVCEACAYEL